MLIDNKIKEYAVTVFTPTFNRAYTLPDLYDSLKRQTKKEFEWLIVDDGSTDKTDELVNSWIAEGTININYVKKDNGGKHTAINMGADIARGELFAIVDSDDFFLDNAIERILFWHNTIKTQEVEKRFCGLFFLQSNIIDGEIVSHGDTFEGTYEDFVFDDASAHGVRGEHVMVFYTDVLKNYKFPVFSGEKFVPEGVLINNICDGGYTIRWVNEIIQVFEYRNDGLSMQNYELYWRNAKAYACWILNRAFTNGKKPSLITLDRMRFQYYWELKDRLSLKEIASNIHVSRVKLRFIILIHKVKKMFEEKDDE